VEKPVHRSWLGISLFIFLLNFQHYHMTNAFLKSVQNDKFERQQLDTTEMLLDDEII